MPTYRVDRSDVPALIKEKCDDTAAACDVMFKVRFEIGDKLKLKGTCYVKESGTSQFTLDSTHDGSQYGTNDFRFDIARPGM